MKMMDIINLGNVDQNKEKEHNEKRLIVYAVFDGVDPDKRLMSKIKPVYFHQDYLEYDNLYNEHIEIQYKNIDQVTLSMCSRLHNRGVFSEFRFYIDIDFHVEDQVYQLEVHNMQTMNYLIDLIKNNDWNCQDEVGVLKIYTEHPDYLERYRWFQKSFKNIAKEHHLDHPRGSMITGMFSNY